MPGARTQKRRNFGGRVRRKAAAGANRRSHRGDQRSPSSFIFICNPRRESPSCCAAWVTLSSVSLRAAVIMRTFDFVTMGIALRHVSDLKATFSEYFRVLKPGGKIWILEAHVPRSRVGHALTRIFWAKVIPGLTLLFTRSRDAKLLMDYYWDTIDQCVPPREIVQAIHSAGFEHGRVRVTAPGMFCEYKGQKAGAG